MQQAYIDAINKKMGGNQSYQMESPKYSLASIIGASLIASGSIAGGVVYGLKPLFVRVPEDQDEKIEPKDARLDKTQALLVFFVGTVLVTSILSIITYYASR